MILSALANAHSESPAVVLVMGSNYCFKGIMLTRIPSSKVSCQILNVHFSSLFLLKRACSEDFEGLSNFFPYCLLLQTYSLFFF